MLFVSANSRNLISLAQFDFTSVSQIVSSKIYIYLQSQNVILFRKRVLTEVFLKDSKMRPSRITLGPKCNSESSKKEKRHNTTAQGGSNENAETEITVTSDMQHQRQLFSCQTPGK